VIYLQYASARAEKTGESETTCHEELCRKFLKEPAEVPGNSWLVWLTKCVTDVRAQLPSITFAEMRVYMPPCSGSVQCTVYRVQSTVHSVQCTVCSVQCTVYSVQCAVYSVQCTVRSVQCTVYSAECTEYSVQCTVYSVPYTVYTVKSTVYSGQCTVYDR
jgi:hypothetical protein